jgi:hypothetical protein
MVIMATLFVEQNIPWTDSVHCIISVSQVKFTSSEGKNGAACYNADGSSFDDKRNRTDEKNDLAAPKATLRKERKKERKKERPCLVHSENQKIFKILRHIESCGICMKH